MKCHRPVFLFAAGTIPSELCNSTSMSVDVSGTSIDCYSGCLTSSAVTVDGASSQCHDGSILRAFLLFVGLFVAVGLLSNILFHLRGSAVAAPQSKAGFLSSFRGSCWSCVQMGRSG